MKKYLKNEKFVILLGTIIIIIYFLVLYNGLDNNSNIKNNNTTIQNTENTTEISEPSNLEIMSYSQTVLDEYVDNPSYSRDENDYNIITNTNLRYKIEGKVNNEKFWLIIEFTDNTYKEYDVISLQVGNEKLVK